MSIKSTQITCPKCQSARVVSQGSTFESDGYACSDCGHLWDVLRHYAAGPEPVHIVVKPENKGYDITAYRGKEVVMSTWKGDRQSALWTADTLRNAYPDEHGRPAPVEGGLKTWEKDFALTSELERALSTLTEFCTSGRRYKTQNPYTIPEIKGALKALAWAKGMDVPEGSDAWMDANNDAPHTGTTSCVKCSAPFTPENPCFNSYATFEDGTHDGGECALCAAKRGSLAADRWLTRQAFLKDARGGQ